MALKWTPGVGKLTTEVQPNISNNFLSKQILLTNGSIPYYISYHILYDFHPTIELQISYPHYQKITHVLWLQLVSVVLCNARVLNPTVVWHCALDVERHNWRHCCIPPIDLNALTMPSFKTNTKLTCSIKLNHLQFPIASHCIYFYC